MKICVFGTSFLPTVGGMEYVMHDLSNALVEIGHEVSIIAQRVSWQKPLDQRQYKLNLYGLPRGGGRLGLNFCSAQITASMAHWSRKFDVIHCHGVSYSGTRVRMLKKLLNLPVVMTPHGEDIQKIEDIGYGLRLDPSWDRIITRNLRAAEYVTAISQSIHNDLDVVSEERIVDIPNGVHVERFSGPKTDYLRDCLGIPADKKIILSVGRNHIKKGYDFGIRAIMNLVKNMGYTDVHYVIVGRNVSEHKVLVEECQAENYVSLLEEVPPDKVTQCYKSSDIFFSPSIVEGLSLVSIEAMAAGLPLLVTNVPGNEDVVKDNGCGIIVDDQNVESMAQGMIQLLDNDAHRLKLAELSKKHAPRYDWTHIAVMYEDVFRRAIEDCRSGYKGKNKALSKN